MKCKRLRRTTIKAGTFHPGIARDFPDDVLLRNMSAREYQTMRQQTESPLFPFWVEGRGSSFFLASLVLATIFVPMITLSRYGRIGFGLMFALMPFSGAVASIRKRMTGTVYKLAPTGRLLYPTTSYWTGLKSQINRIGAPLLLPERRSGWMAFRNTKY